MNNKYLCVMKKILDESLQCRLAKVKMARATTSSVPQISRVNALKFTDVPTGSPSQVHQRLFLLNIPRLSPFDSALIQEVEFSPLTEKVMCVITSKFMKDKSGEIIVRQ